MDAEREGLRLWYDTPEQAAGGTVTLTIGVAPPDGSNRAEVRYRVNGGSIRSAPAPWLRNDPVGEVQYFRATIPNCAAGDIVNYAVVCQCAGRQVPSPEDADALDTTFRVPGGSPATQDEPAGSKSSSADATAAGVRGQVDVPRGRERGMIPGPADGPLLAAEQQYELFWDVDGAPCDVRLPLQRTRDVYDFIEFVALVDNGKPAVLPGYALQPPQGLADLNDGLKEALRGQTPLADAWAEPQVLSQLTPKIWVDPAEVLGTGRVTYDGKEYDVTYGSTEIHALLARVPASVMIGEGDEAQRVQLIPRAPNRETAPACVEFIDDLVAFLDGRTLPSGNRVSLTDAQVNDLSQLGFCYADVKTSSGDERTFIALRGWSTPADSLKTSATSPSSMVGRQHLGPMLGTGTVAPSKSRYLVRENNALDPSSTAVVVPRRNEMPLAPTVTIAVGLPAGYRFVLALPYKQVWQLKGYTRGELLNSIALTPQEETTIEVFSWDRHKTDREQTSSFEETTSIEASHNHKESRDTFAETAHTAEWQLDEHLTAGVKGFGLQVNNTNKQTWSDVARQTTNKIDEATQKASSIIKSSQQTKVSETAEFGSETRVTRKIRNQNMVRTLTFDYFEVLSSYAVETQLDKSHIRLGVLVDNMLPGPIDRQFVLVHEGVLQRVLRHEAYRPGFDAARMLDGYDRICEITAATACAAPEQPVIGEEPIPPNLDKALSRLLISVNALISAHLTDFINESQLTYNASNGAFDGITEVARRSLQCWLYRTIALERACPQFWNSMVSWFFSVTPNADGSIAYTEGFLTALRQLLRQPRSEVVTASSLPNARLSDFAEVMSWLGTAFPFPAGAAAFVHGGFEDAGFEAALAMTRSALAGMRQTPYVPPKMYTAAPPPGATGTVSPPDPLTDPLGWLSATVSNVVVEVTNALVGTKGSAATTEQIAAAANEAAKTVVAMADPATVRGYDVKEIVRASVNEAQLLHHLRLNQTFYRQAIWRALEPGDRYNLLRARGDGLLNYADNEVLGFADGLAVMPFRLAVQPQVQAWFNEQIVTNEYLPPKSSEPPSTLTLPTGGVSVQTRIGRCDTGETFVMDHRELDVAMRQAEVDQAVQEVERMKKRLAAAPPLLDDPTPNDGSTPIRISLDKPS